MGILCIKPPCAASRYLGKYSTTIYLSKRLDIWDVMLDKHLA